MREIVVQDNANQRFSVVLGGRRCTIRLCYNVLVDRWFMDLSIDDEPILTGRKLVTGVDLLAPFDLGLGKIGLVAEQPGAVPDRDNFPAGIVRMYHLEPGE